MDVKLPNLGEGADSGSIVSIMVKPGDIIEKGQTLLELENEKAVAAIPSSASGKVEKIHVKEGQKISVGQRILTLSEASSAAPAKSPQAAAPAAPPVPKARPAPPKTEEEEEEGEEPPSPEPEAEETPEEPVGESEETTVPAEEEAASASDVPPAPPSIRKIARELGIDLSRIRGSERGGRIVMADLRDYIQRLQKLASASKQSAVKSTSASAAAPKAPPIDFSKWGPILSKPMTSLRQTISRKMHESWQAIPHVTQFDEADMTVPSELRTRYADAYEKQGARLTLTPFLLKAVIKVLEKYPIFNSSLDESAQQVVYKQYYHIGMAVDTEAGLIVPVIRDVDKKSLIELSRELQDLAERTRNRKINSDELQGGSFTISNQGGIGGAHFTPIINRPEVAILGVGRSLMKPVVRDQKIEPRLMLPLCLSYDHRLIDGGSAARFIVELGQALSQFNEDEVKI